MSNFKINARCTKEKMFLAFLKNGQQVKGKYVELTTPEGLVRKVFFRTKDGKKELVLKNLTVPLQSGNESIVCTEINEYLLFLLEQAKLEFPEWIDVNGIHAGGIEASYAVWEIKREWKSMKALFGKFRIAALAGFFTSTFPQDSQIVYIKSIGLFEDD